MRPTTPPSGPAVRPAPPVRHAVRPGIEPHGGHHPAHQGGVRRALREVAGRSEVHRKGILVGEALAGTIGCFPMDGQDHVGYWIDRAYWGTGIASRALALLLREVEKRPLVAVAATGNAASIRVLRKCGFVVEQVRLAPASDRYLECEEAVLVLPATVEFDQCSG